jgi:multidrug efflux system outer membrane protein
MRKGLSAIALGLLAAACAPNYTLPPTQLPESAAPGEKVVVAKDWWRAYRDPVLDRLIESAFAASPTLALAVAKVDAAQARAGISGSQQLPAVNVGAGAQRQRLSAETNPGAAGDFTVYAASLQAYWEIDLWGRIRNEVAASQADLLGAGYARDAAQLALAAQVAQAYFQLRAYDEELAVTRRTVGSREQSYELRRKRFAGGITSELDLRQAESELAIARAQVPDLADAVARAEGTLAILTGMPPAELFGKGIPRGQGIDAIPVPPSVPQGLPSDLLLRRPDIQEAEQGLRATQARVAAARTAWFPTISLTGAYGGESLALGDLFGGPARAWSFAGSLAAPLFNAGLTAAQVDLASANERAAAATYRDTVARAFSDTRNAITAHKQGADRVAARAQSVDALRRQVRLATLRYDNGYSNYLEVLDAERALFSAELSLSEARRAHLAATVDLYRALGGGWTRPAGAVAAGP